MIDASYELQIAIVERLKAYGPLVALIGQRVYDSVPRDSSGNVSSATFPYVSFGPETAVGEQFECIIGSEITIQLDAWSRGVGFPEVKKIAGAVRAALHNYPLPLAENALVSFEYEGRRIFRDPDGKTSHAVLTFRAIVEHD